MTTCILIDMAIQKRNGKRANHLLFMLLEKEWNYPRFRQNFELLATRGRMWPENHFPKVKEP
jgi:hypothetical protein